MRNFHWVRRVFVAVLLAVGGPAVATSSTQAQTLIVLDASGSMWGVIDGQPKIAIARTAVHAMLEGWHGGDLGLIAYGHRRKGDCADIELLVAPSASAADEIGKRVDALQPKGMTPIVAAVREAAETLRYTEQKATVVLVSDGEETCDADPCALGAELEVQGVDFTAHVVGFDIGSNSAARKQLECLAKATGGRYFDAHSAGELDAALRSVAVQSAGTVPPASAPDCGTFIGGDPYMDGLATWPTGTDSADVPGSGRKDFDGVEMAPDETPQACRALCEADALCAVWYFEPVGSNFRTQPVCHRWDRSVAISPPTEGHPGSATGIRSGVRPIQTKEGAACADSAAE